MNNHRDNWDCEICEVEHPRTETYYSHPKCNDWGKGVVLCNRCGTLLVNLDDELAYNVLQIAWDSRGMEEHRTIIQ